MEPEERAFKMIEQFIPHTRVFHEVLGWEDYIDSAKECAILTIDQIILEISKHSNEFKSPRLQDERIDYWFKVKQEIKNYKC